MPDYGAMSDQNTGYGGDYEGNYADSIMDVIGPPEQRGWSPVDEQGNPGRWMDRRRKGWQEFKQNLKNISPTTKAVLSMLTLKPIPAALHTIQAIKKDRSVRAELAAGLVLEGAVENEEEALSVINELADAMNPESLPSDGADITLQDFLDADDMTEEQTMTPRERNRKEAEAYLDSDPSVRAAYEQAKSVNNRWTPESWARANYQERKAAGEDVTWPPIELLTNEITDDDATGGGDPYRNVPGGATGKTTFDDFLKNWYGIGKEGDEDYQESYRDRIMGHTGHMQDAGRGYLSEMDTGQAPYRKMLEDTVRRSRPIGISIGGKPVTQFTSRPDRQAGVALGELVESQAGKRFAMADLLSPERGGLDYLKELQAMAENKYRIDVPAETSRYATDQQYEPRFSWLGAIGDIINIGTGGKKLWDMF